LPKIARAFARPDAPKNLEPLELWQDTLQSCGYSLEGVLAEFRRTLDTLAAEDRAFIDGLPRPTATVKRTATEIIIHADPREISAAGYEMDTPPRQPDGTFRLSRSLYGYGTLKYQLGWRVEGTHQPLLDE